MKRLIVIEIDANGRYCNNNCRFMSNDAKHCWLWDKDLVWNYRKKENGNFRLAECKAVDLNGS